METNSVRPWNVFLPNEILCEPSGYLIGTVYHHINMVCVHGLLYKEQKTSPHLSIVGHWQLDETDKLNHCDSMKPLSGFMFSLFKQGQLREVCCKLAMRSPNGTLTEHPVVCIFFNIFEVGSSYVFLHFTENRNDKNNFKTENDKFKNPENTISVLARSIQEQQTKLKLETCSGVKSLYKSGLSSSGTPSRILLPVSLFLIGIVCHIGHFFSLGLKYFHMCCFLLPELVQTSSLIQHLHQRAFTYQTILLLDRKERFQTFFLYNCCANQLMDTCLGLVLIVLFLNYGLANQISSYILDWADDIAGELITLVQWLMGSPAGLKLNAQLTKFLGHFFIYHIHLWTGYLTLLRNMMPSIILACSFTGVLGLSTQMCLAADVLSMLTLHIYCFYVYAAKIFNLQIYVMGSLWRLFRGKKWNILRSRVDSASYNIDQLFFGTLLFTILLFLLPTTALYYTVFTSLRLLVLTVQGLLSSAVAMVTSAPVFTIVCRLLAPKLVAGSVVFKVAHISEDENSLLLNMKNQYFANWGSKQLHVSAWRVLLQTRTDLVAVDDLPIIKQAIQWLSEREAEQLWECPVCNASLSSNINVMGVLKRRTEDS